MGLELLVRYWKTTLVVISFIATFISTYAFEVYPWPGYRVAHAIQQLQEQTTYLKIKDIKRDMAEAGWDLIKLEDHMKDQGYENINGAPIMIQEIYFEKKEQYKEMKSALENLTEHKNDGQEN